MDFIILIRLRECCSPVTTFLLLSLFTVTTDCLNMLFLISFEDVVISGYSAKSSAPLKTRFIRKVNYFGFKFPFTNLRFSLASSSLSLSEDMISPGNPTRFPLMEESMEEPKIILLFAIVIKAPLFVYRSALILGLILL